MRYRVFYHAGELCYPRIILRGKWFKYGFTSAWGGFLVPLDKIHCQCMHQQWACDYLP
jgi:hypothetical protein